MKQRFRAKVNTSIENLKKLPDNQFLGWYELLVLTKKINQIQGEVLVYAKERKNKIEALINSNPLEMVKAKLSYHVFIENLKKKMMHSSMIGKQV